MVVEIWSFQLLVIKPSWMCIRRIDKIPKWYVKMTVKIPKWYVIILTRCSVIVGKCPSLI